VVTDERAHVEEYDMSGNRVHQYATAVVNAKVDMPSGKCQHQGLNEMRKRILATLATNMTDVGPTCEASSVSDCIATITPVTSVTQSNATMPTTAPRHKTPGHWFRGRAGRPSRRRPTPPGLPAFPGVGPTRRDARWACRRRLRSPTRP
jgi:hypothetical protein